MEPLTKDEQLLTLRSAFPRWEIWTVPVHDGFQPDLRWCARHRVYPGILRHAWEARHLGEYMREAEAEASGWF